MTDVASTEFDDYCPFSGQEHKYFIFKTFEMYEPATGYIYAPEDKDHRTLYDKKEYAVLGCNCGSVIRKEIQKV
jgi:hypothetical protein